MRDVDRPRFNSLDDMYAAVERGEIEFHGRRTDAQLAADRALVYRLRQTGHSLDQCVLAIWNEHGRFMAPGTVTDDYKIARRDYRQLMAEEIEERVSEEIARLEAREYHLWQRINEIIRGDYTPDTREEWKLNRETGELELVSRRVNRTPNADLAALYKELTSVQAQRMKALGIGDQGLIQLNIGDNRKQVSNDNRTVKIVGFSPEEWDMLPEGDVIEGE